MPYISNKRIAALWGDSLEDRDDWMKCSGELNYKVTELINDYLVRFGLSYQTCNDIVGALDNAKSEFKRRVQDPYEDRKIKENGDVYLKEFLNGGKKRGKKTV